MAILSALTDPSLTIIFATSPYGLGHLRVTEALYRGLPKGASPVLLGAQAPSASDMYRFISIHPITRRIMEISQVAPFDRLTAYIGRRVLQSQTKLIDQQLRTILNERLTVAKTTLIVATHAFHGHAVGAIKQKLAQEMGTRVLLIVQVTDDSPQPIWYVSGADLIFVPSEYTKQHLVTYAQKARLPLVPIVVAAYPISPLLAEDLTEHSFIMRLKQSDPQSKETIHMSVPVSGAAVGTSFISDYMKTLHSTSSRFHFHVISREAPFTELFIKAVANFPYINLATSSHDRTTVENYEQVFKEFPIALELTKPSEQAFKALASPKQRGGVILLFSNPVGRQEYDNLHFLRVHGLMPHTHENQRLWQKAANNEPLKKTELLEKAHKWRAVLLPDDPLQAANFTRWCLEEGLFTRMMHFKPTAKNDEFKPNGVEQFWNKVSKLVETTSLKEQ